jgi:pyruvate-formate lyase
MLAVFNSEIQNIAQGYSDNRILFPTGAGSFEFYMLGGSFLGALPDGRRSRVALSSNLSPSLGVALEGITSTINSFACLGLQDLATGSPLDLSVEKKFLAGEEGLERLHALVQTFLDKGGNMLNISVNSVEELRQAQREPEKYRHLRVRMGGWQAYFVDLTKQHQDHHIARLELYA